MSVFAGPVATIAGIAAAALIYFLAWRLTRGRSLGVRALVRAGLPLLVLGPVLAVALLGTSLEPIPEKIDGRLSTAPAEEAMRDRAPDTAGGEAPDTQERRRETVVRPLKIPGAPEQGQGGQPEAASPEFNPNVRLDSVAPEGTIVSEEPSAAANGRHDTGPLTIEPPVAPAAPSSETTKTAPPDDDAGGLAGTAPPADRKVAAKSRSVEEAQTDWDVVPVFYGTDRQQEPNPERVAYNSERGRRLELGRALVTVPKSHEVPQIERPWTLRIPYFNVTIYEEAENPKKHFTMQEIKALSRDDFLKMVRERLGGSDRYKDHAIVFVHGYNTSFDHAVYRTAQIAYDLKFDGATFVYSWPSGGAVASYTYDRESAGAAEPYLRQFLDLVVKESGAKSISVIAHSMGNLPLLEVLKDMRSQSPPGVVISQVILAAPDVDADNFANLTRDIQGFAKGVTLYVASNDRALIISRNFWQNPRAGDVLAAGPLIVPGIDTIDVTAASTDSFALNHSGYAENNNLLQDIGKLILSGLRPPEQRLPQLKRVTTEKGDYWRYVASP